MVQKIIDASNFIHKASISGQSNFIIVSGEVAEELLKLDPEYIRQQRRKKLQQIAKNKN